MRNSSAIMTRITLTRSGTSMPASRLDRQHVGQVVHHAAQVVDAIGVGDVGVPGLALAHLFGAAVVKADVGHGIDDLLAVELQDDAQDAVGARMLGSQVEKHEIGVLSPSLQPPFLRVETAGPPAPRPARSGGSWKGSISVARAGCSLRRGWPCQVGGIRIRRRWGWPSKAMPNMSHTSRSYQLAAGQRSVIVGRLGYSPLSGTLMRTSCVAIEGQQVIDDGEIALPAGLRGGSVPARRWRSDRRACGTACRPRFSGTAARRERHCGRPTGWGCRRGWAAVATTASPIARSCSSSVMLRDGVSPDSSAVPYSYMIRRPQVRRLAAFFALEIAHRRVDGPL